NQHIAVPQHLPQTSLCKTGSPRPVAIQTSLQPVALVRRQPSRVCGTVGQHEQARQPEQYCRNAFDDEHPLPAANAEPAIETEKRSRDWRSQETGNGNSDCEERDDARTVLGWKPVGEVQHHPRKESCFGSAEEESH